MFLKGWFTVWEHIKSLGWKYVNTAEIIRKVTMTLLIKSNKDFDWVKNSLSILFSQCKVSLCQRNTPDHMLVAFWRTLVKIVVVFQHKRQRNKSFARFVDNLKTRTRTCRARAALQYPNELSLLVRVRLPCKNKLFQSGQTSRTNKKLSKQGLVMINHTLANSQINSISGANSFLRFSYRTFIYRTNTKVYAYN